MNDITKPRPKSRGFILYILTLLVCITPGCKREKPQLMMRPPDQTRHVRALEAQYFDLYIPFGIISRELLFESSDSSIAQIRYHVAHQSTELRSLYLANMDAQGWVLKVDIDGNPKILLFKKPQATCIVSLQSVRENETVINVSLQHVIGIQRLP